MFIPELRHIVISGVAVLAGTALIALIGTLRTRRTTKTSSGKRGRGIVWGVTLTAATLLGVVIVLTQVGFYRANLGDATPVEWLPWLNLAFLTPIAVEANAWVFTVMVSFAVINNRPSGRYERLMWLFSAIAAGVNAWHNIGRGDWLTGIVLGGMSIAGPLMVHMTLRWDRDIQDDRTAKEIREAALKRAAHIARRGAQVTRHPVHSWRTVAIATNLDCTWDQAYRVALTGQYGTVHAVLVDQVRRSMPAVHTIEVEDNRTGIARALRRAPKSRTEVVHETSEEGMHDAADEDVHGPVGEEIFPACTDPLIADLHKLNDPGALFAKWWPNEPVHDDGAHGATSDDEGVHDPVHDESEHGVHGDVHGPVQGPVHGLDQSRAHRARPVENEGVHGARDGVHDHAQPPVHGPATQPPKPRAQKSAQAPAKRAQSTNRTRARSSNDGAREVVHAQSERQEHVAARHWWSCTNDGADPRARTNADIARELGINPSAVSRGFKWAEQGFDPDKEA